MANHIVLIGASGPDSNTAATSLNTSLAAEITAAAPQDVRLVNTASATSSNTTVSVTVAFVVALVQFVG